jgi:hypothetical protein
MGQASDLQLRASCETVAIQQGREHGSRGIPIVGSRYLATTIKQTEGFMGALVAVIYNV